MGWVHELLDELEVDADARRRIWGGTAAAWLGRDAAAAGARAAPALDGSARGQRRRRPAAALARRLLLKATDR